MGTYTQDVQRIVHPNEMYYAHCVLYVEMYPVNGWKTMHILKLDGKPDRMIYKT